MEDNNDELFKVSVNTGGWKYFALIVALIVLCATFLIYTGKLKSISSPIVSCESAAPATKLMQEDVQEKIESYTDVYAENKKILADGNVDEGTKERIRAMQAQIRALMDTAEAISRLMLDMDEKPEEQRVQIINAAYQFLSAKQNPNIKINYGLKTSEIVKDEIIGRLKREKESVMRNAAMSLKEKDSKIKALMDRENDYVKVCDKLTGDVDDLNRTVRLKDDSLSVANGEKDSLANANGGLQAQLARSRKPEVYSFAVSIDGAPTKRDNCYKLKYVSEVGISYGVRHSDRSITDRVQSVLFKCFFAPSKGAAESQTQILNREFTEQEPGSVVNFKISESEVGEWREGYYFIDVYIDGVYQERKEFCVERILK